jgi:hypothetical protein
MGFSRLRCKGSVVACVRHTREGAGPSFAAAAEHVERLAGEQSQQVAH